MEKEGNFMIEKEKYKVGYHIKMTKDRKSSNALASQIEEILDEKHIVVACPISKGRYVFWDTGKKVTLSYCVENRGVFVFDAVVEKYFHENEIVLLKMRVDSGIEKIQIRNYFRLEETWEIKIDVYNDSGKEVIASMNGKTVDISGGGMKILSFYPLKPSAIVEIALNQEKYSNLFRARVIRTQEVEDESEFKYISSVKFEKLNVKEQEKLIRFLFDCQRIERAKDQKIKGNETYGNYGI